MSQIVGCVLMPHPPLLIPEIGKKHLHDVEKSKLAMEDAAGQVKAWNPDTVVIITPHGPVFRDAISLAAQEQLQGSFANFGAPDIRIRADVDLSLVNRLVKLADERNIAVLRVTEASAKKYGLSTTLDHGAMVPLYYLAKSGVKAKIVHVSIGWLDYEELYSFGKVIQDAVAEGEENVAVICSGDLSHRLTPDAPAGFSERAAEFDQRIVTALSKCDVQAIRELDPDLVEEAGECGLRPIYILLGVLEGLSARSKVHSYEGPFGVGYAVVQFSIKGGFNVEEHQANTTKQENPLVNLARRSLEHYVLTGRRLDTPETLAPELSGRAGVFVSLKKHGQLRGCIGTFAPTQPSIAQEIMANAVSAGTGDPRFFPVEADELNEIDYSVDVLSEPKPVRSLTELDPKKYGIILRKGHRSGLLLPDLEGVDTVEEQVAIAKQKAGIRQDDPVELYRFTVTRHK